MNIKALPSIGQRLFCCFCFVESAVCSTFAKRIIRGCLGGYLQGVHLYQVHQQSKKYTNRARSAPPKLHQQSKKCANRATLVHLRQVHPLKAPLKAPLKTLTKL